MIGLDNVNPIQILYKIPAPEEIMNAQAQHGAGHAGCPC